MSVGVKPTLCCEHHIS